MFTGLVEALGRVNRVESNGGDCRLWLDMGSLPLDAVNVGDSISISGTCLTVVVLAPPLCAFDVSLESLRVTSLAEVKAGDRVNVERSLTLNKPLGGHMVLGHVDGQGRVVSCCEAGRSWRIEIEVQDELVKYIAPKGSITLDGISLTVNDFTVSQAGSGVLSVNVIPHTYGMTTVQDWCVGRAVNVEVDVMARYVEALMRGGVKPVGMRAGGDADSSGLTLETLAKHGFAAS
ncbi:MAG: riboflavin synthase [Gammaproteobacteria bacterium]